MPVIVLCLLISNKNYLFCLLVSNKSTTFAPTRTRQASSQCLNRRVVLFLYDEQQNPIPETIRPMLPNRMTGSWITLPTDALRIYFNLCIIKYFLNIISPNNDMKAKVDALLAAYPSIDIFNSSCPQKHYLSPDFNYKAAGEIWGDAHRRRE